MYYSQTKANMHRTTSFLLVVSLSFNSIAIFGQEKLEALKINEKGRTNILFDSPWRFHLGEVSGAEKSSFDNSSWRLLDLHHDWNIEDLPWKNFPSDSLAIGGGSIGYIDFSLQKLKFRVPLKEYNSNINFV